MHETLTLQVVLATATSVRTLTSSVQDGVFGNKLSSQSSQTLAGCIHGC